MPAIQPTQFGTAVSWGIAEAETGFLVNSISHKYSTDIEEIPGRFGSTETVVYYNESVSISMDGELPASGGFSGTLATALSLGNDISAMLKNGVSGGSTYIESITIDMNRKGAKTFKIEAKYRPL